MTRCYLDANFLYARVRTNSRAGAAERVAVWGQMVADEAGDDALWASALVVDELAYRLTLSWLRDDGMNDPLTTFRTDAGSTMRRVRGRLDQVLTALDAALDIVPSDRSVVLRARGLMADPGLASRDAFHAAHAIEGGCGVIVSSDGDFDRVRGLRRLGPPK